MGKEKGMKLEELLGADLYAQVKAKLDEVNANEPDKLKHVRYADLSEGEYVGKGKYPEWPTPNGASFNIEVKASKTAPLTNNQKELYPQIAKYGGKVVGKKYGTYDIEPQCKANLTFDLSYSTMSM